MILARERRTQHDNQSAHMIKGTVRRSPVRSWFARADERGEIIN
jgi:hypothetical protein